MKAGYIRIAKERKRQFKKKGYNFDHDDEHTKGGLAVTAAMLAVHGTDASVEDPLERGTPRLEDEVMTGDKWGLLNKHKNDDIKRLTIAGALIAAEIDRLQRRFDREKMERVRKSHNR